MIIFLFFLIFVFFSMIFKALVVYRVKGDDPNKPHAASEWYWVYNRVERGGPVRVLLDFR